ncbi:MAG: hypothetical protein U1F25_14985 [Rubrivivax sp.]
MTALVESAAAPAQFAFDHGALGGTAGRFAFVVSGAAPWSPTRLRRTRRDGARPGAFGDAQGTWPTTPRVLKVIVERRATFRCTPALARPPMAIAPDCWPRATTSPAPTRPRSKARCARGEQAVEALTPQQPR